MNAATEVRLNLGRADARVRYGDDQGTTLIGEGLDASGTLTRRCPASIIPSGLGVYGKTSTGYGGFFEGKVYTTKWYELTEISTPPNPVANRARLFLKDNGLGKTQLCVKFANGTVKVLATEG
jgi:hypothetical protein